MREGRRRLHGGAFPHHGQHGHVKRAWSICDFRAFEQATSPERLRACEFAVSDDPPVWARSATLRARKETPGSFVDGAGS